MVGVYRKSLWRSLFGKSSVVDKFQTDSLAVMVQKFPDYTTEKKQKSFYSRSFTLFSSCWVHASSRWESEQLGTAFGAICFFFKVTRGHAHGSWGKSSATGPHWQPCIAFIWRKSGTLNLFNPGHPAWGILWKIQDFLATQEQKWGTRSH